MKTFIDGLGVVAGLLLIGGGIAATIFGIHHAGSKHDSGFVALAFPPYAWYRAVEAVGWHDDFAGLDWEERLAADTKILMALLGSDPATADAATVFQIEKAKEFFRDQISDYPEDKHKYLKQVALVHMSFQQSLMRDLFRYARMVYDDETDVGVTFVRSEETARLERTLATYTDELNNANVAFDLLAKQIADAVRKGRGNVEYSEFEKLAAANADRARTHTAAVYRAVFGEDIDDKNLIPLDLKEDDLQTEYERERITGELLKVPLDNPGPQYQEGLFYYEGSVRVKDYAQAFKWFEKAAEQGHSKAQFMLASMYLNGEGAIKSRVESLKWYQLSAQQGHVPAQSALGVLYLETKNYHEAFVWLEKAAKQGDEIGIGGMILMHEGGLEKGKDNIQAYAWANVMEALHNENANASVVRERLASQMSTNDITEAEILSKEYFDELKKAPFVIAR